LGSLNSTSSAKARKRVEICCHHLQLEGAGAADVVAGHDLGQGADGFFQRTRALAVVALGIQPHEGEHAQADAAPVDLGAVAGDVALLLEPRTRRQVGAALRPMRCGQLGVREMNAPLPEHIRQALER
jgi:hypothetical protein